MALANYSDLKSSIATWMARSDMSGTAADVVTLAEGRLNRELEAVETTVTLTGVANSRTIDVSAYSIIEPISLWVTPGSGQDEDEVEFKAPGTFAYLDSAGQPGMVALNGTNLKFDRPCDQAYSFRFHYRGRFALSDSATTNDLLTNHPDVYLAACLVWGNVYIMDAAKAAGFKALLDEFIRETKSHLAQRKRGTLTVDPALSTGREDYWWRQGA